MLHILRGSIFLVFLIFWVSNVLVYVHVGNVRVLEIAYVVMSFKVLKRI